LGNNGCDSACVENDEVTCSVSSPYHPFLLHPCHPYQPSLFLPLGNQPPLLQLLSSGKTHYSKTHIPLSQVLYGNLLSSQRVIKILRDTRVSLQVTFDKMQEDQGRVCWHVFKYDLPSCISKCSSNNLNWVSNPSLHHIHILRLSVFWII
jgi:hypothetical protein